ncbi:MAG: hypothetical protein R3E32_20240 [Chitinophagales bacterium]
MTTIICTSRFIQANTMASGRTVHCHTNPNNFAEFTCTSCHTNPETDNEHTGVGGYNYSLFGVSPDRGFRHGI